MKLITASVVTALFYCTAANAAHPQPPVSSKVAANFGMIGLSHFDTARLNLVNTNNPTIAATPIPALCQAKLRFLDTAGQVLVNSEVVLASGQAGHLDLTHANIPGTARRAQVRAQIATLDNPAPASLANCVATIEVFNSISGRTYSIYPDAPVVYLTPPNIIHPPFPPPPPPIQPGPVPPGFPTLPPPAPAPLP